MLLFGLLFFWRDIFSGLGFCFSQETFFRAWAFVFLKRRFFWLGLLFFPRDIFWIFGLPAERDRKNPVLFHVATLSSAHRKSRPKLKLGPDVLHPVVIEVIGLACHVTTSLICIYVSNLSPHETICPKNSTLSDLAGFWPVVSSGSGAFFQID